MADHKFSEVALAYNSNAASLNEARLVFQREIEDLNTLVSEHLEDYRCRSHDEEKVYKLRWSSPVNWSTSKDGPWLNYIASTCISMAVKRPTYAVFKNDAAKLFFETRFDSEFGKFMFRARFENSNSVNKNFDEKIVEILNSEKPSECKNYVQVKSNTAILFRHELDDSLFNNLHDYMDSALSICEKSVDLIYPDSDYAKSSDESASDQSEGEDVELNRQAS